MDIFRIQSYQTHHFIMESWIKLYVSLVSGFSDMVTLLISNSKFRPYDVSRNFFKKIHELIIIAHINWHCMHIIYFTDWNRKEKTHLCKWHPQSSQGYPIFVTLSSRLVLRCAASRLVTNCNILASLGTGPRVDKYEPNVNNHPDNPEKKVNKNRVRR